MNICWPQVNEMWSVTTRVAKIMALTKNNNKVMCYRPWGKIYYWRLVRLGLWEPCQYKLWWNLQDFGNTCYKSIWVFPQDLWKISPQWTILNMGLNLALEQYFFHVAVYIIFLSVRVELYEIAIVKCLRTCHYIAWNNYELSLWQWWIWKF